jgi:hypothetical protein
MQLFYSKKSGGYDYGIFESEDYPGILLFFVDWKEWLKE